MDALASEYGWTKEVIFEAYPQEVEILMRRIRERKEAKDDADLLRMITAAQVPHLEDGGKSIVNTILSRHKHKQREEAVTEESIKRELAIANMLLRR